MPRPVALKNGVYHLNVRVPADIAAKVKGTSVTLRLDGRPVAVKASDKVIVSLRTKSPDAAKVRFAEAHASLAQHWAMVRQGPLPLTHKQVVAIAGVFYRQQVALRERESGFTPEALQDELDAFDGAAEAWNHADPAGFVDDPDLDARLMALLDKPDGDALFAFRGRGDVDTDSVSITYVEALERLFGPATDRLCHKLGVRVEDTSRPRLLREGRLRLSLRPPRARRPDRLCTAAPRLAVRAGPLGVRACFAGLDTLDATGLDGDDRYLVQLWPAAAPADSGTRVLKAWPP